MFDFAAARETMLDCQIRTNDVTDHDIQAAFRAVPRECFVPKAKTALAYSDVHIDLGEGRYMLRPRDFAKMLDAADITSTDVVLNIGCGRGYSVAVLSQLAETVVALEQSERNRKPRDRTTGPLRHNQFSRSPRRFSRWRPRTRPI